VSRRQHSVQYKLAVVREAGAPGISAREVARRHGLHESLIGAWRRLYAQGRLQESSDGVVPGQLLAVKLRAQAAHRTGRAEASIEPRALAEGTMDVEFLPGHRLSVRGAVDASTLSVILRELSRS
jgi:transposase